MKESLTQWESMKLVADSLLDSFTQKTVWWVYIQKQK